MLIDALQTIPYRRAVTARVAGFLAAEAARAGSDQLTLTSTREEIAARLGTVCELVSRGLSRLQEDGILTVRRQRVQIKDRIRLASVADHGAGAVERTPPAWHRSLSPSGGLRE